MKYKWKIIMLLIPLLLMLTACGSSEETHTDTHWGYEGAEGPTHWGDLNEAYTACKDGMAQSPIDITNPSGAELGEITFNYVPSAVNILNNGHTVQVNYDQGSYIEVDGTRYNLLQFHFHAPSEHAIAGKLAEMELHLVHSDADGNLAVVGVMLYEGKENNAYHPVMDNLPAEENPETNAGTTVNAFDLLPNEKTYYTYPGSLTTPPCSEGVRWLLLNTPVELSSAQIEAYTDIYLGNNRPVQPLNDRTILEQEG